MTTRRPVLRLLLLAAVLLPAGLCAAVLAVGLWLSSPARAVLGPPPPELRGAEAVVVASPSGSRLRGWWVPGQPGGGAVVLMHGVRSNRGSMAQRARVLQGHGFSAQGLEVGLTRVEGGRGV